MLSGRSSTSLLPMTTFPEPFNPEKELVHVRTGKKKRKQEERKKTKRVRNAELPSRSASLVSSMLPHAGDHTGSRAIEWLTEVDRRTHTCLMARHSHVAIRRRVSVMHGKGKAMGQQQVFLEQSMNNLRSTW